MLGVDQAIYRKMRKESIPAGLVLTPGGFRHPSLVHHVPNGHRARRRKQQLQIVHRSSQRIVRRQNLVQNDATEAPIPGLGTGWVTSASWLNPTGVAISQISTTWTVPPAPANGDTGQTVFLFNGLQNPSRSNLLQPVLQWGVSQAGGGGFWSISNWYIDDSGQVCHSDCLQVPPGQVLTGIVALGQESGGLCSYTVGFNGYSFLDLNVGGVDPSPVAVEVLESYNLSGCTDYPATPSTSMSSIFITAGGATPAVDWECQSQSATCGERTTVTSSANPNGEIEISY